MSKNKDISFATNSVNFELISNINAKKEDFENFAELFKVHFDDMYVNLLDEGNSFILTFSSKNSFISLDDIKEIINYFEKYSNTKNKTLSVFEVF